ncbi:hypothetical protein ARMGADRAFT_883158, partial [Armillaria gallica]
LLIYQRLKTKESEIPHQTKLCKVILEKAQEVQSQIKELFKEVSGQISLTFDAWTLKAYDSYLAVMA